MSSSESFLSRWSRRKHDSRSQDGDASPTESREQAGGDGAQRAGPPPALAPTRPSTPVPGVPSAAAGASPAVERGSPAVEGGSKAAEGEPSADLAPAGSSTPASREPTLSGERPEGRPLELPSIDSLTPQSDFRPFMQAGVDASTRNAALAQLFRDPHFNVMDGLDVYIDDYNKTEPIPPTMLAKLRQLHSIGLSEEEIERWTADADGSPEKLARTDEPESPAGGTAVGGEGPPPAEPAPIDETPSAPIRVAQADPISTSTRREDAAAERNSQETGGEDQGSRM